MLQHAYIENVGAVAARFAVGVEVYYTGDMANVDGFGRITKVRPVDRFNTFPTVDVRLDDGREMLGVMPNNFGRGRGGHRFVFRTDYDEDQVAKVAEFMAQYHGK